MIQVSVTAQHTARDLAADFGADVLTYTDDDTPPVGGDTAYMSRFTRRAYADGPQYVVVPVTSWGDYAGSTVERSNARSLVRDYPDVFVLAEGAYSSESLYLPADAPISADLWDTLAGLSDYPLYDENDHSELEWELTDEAWSSYGEYDLRRAVTDALASDSDEAAVLDADLFGIWHDWCESTGYYPEPESATNMVLWRHHNEASLVAFVLDRLGMGA